MPKSETTNKSKSSPKTTAKKSTTKKSGPRSKTKKNAKAQALKKEISGIFIVAFAIFLIVITTRDSQAGIIGRDINIIISAVFGAGSVVMPYAILLIGVMRLLNLVIFDDKNQIAAIAGFFVCYIMYSALHDNTTYELISGNADFNNLITGSIALGNTMAGGGIFGNLLTCACVKLVGKIGTTIILCAMIFIFIILGTNQSIIGGANLAINFLRKIMRAFYDFIFVEADEDDEPETLRRHPRNKPAIEQDDEDENEDLKIFDYTNEQVQLNTKPSGEIMNMKLETQAKEKKQRKSKPAKSQESSDVQKKEEKAPEPGIHMFDSPSEQAAEQIATDAEKSKTTGNAAPNITDDMINIADAHDDDSLQRYKLPSPSLLNDAPAQTKGDKDELKRDAEKLIETLANFNIQCNIVQINKGPTITRYELQPAPGIKVSRITSLTNDLALSLATSDIRMEAPIPGKSAIGIEVPNKTKTDVFLRSLIESKDYREVKTKIPFALGKDIAGKNIIGSIEKMPHLLVAGATGSGKSVCINSLIMSILFKARPDEVKLILIDPKVVELSVYNGIPHLLIPVVTDPRKASNALNWAVSEMTNRYKVFAQNSVRDIFSYNAKMESETPENKMPQIVIIIDELADLMAVASGEVEECITRIAQLARACGIHLVIATQRPSVDVITGVIKANIPSRIAFAVSSYIDSRTILDQSGAEKLLGKGDMLYHPMGMAKPIRIQGTFISDDEIKRVVDSIIEQKIEIRTDKLNEEIERTPNSDEHVDEFLEKAIELVVEDGQASASYIQRKFKVGYSRAARIIDQLEERGIIGGHEGSKPRKVLITKEELEEMRGTEN